MKEWLYWILEEDGRSNYEDEKTGLVSSTVEKRPLRHTPDAWQDISLGFERDVKKLGWLPKFTTEIGFFMDGAKIIRNSIYRSGLGKKLFLLITRRMLDFSSNPSTFRDYHTMFSRHEIEVVQVSDEEDKLTCSLVDTGLSRKLALNMDTKYEFSLSDPEAVSLRYTGVNLHNTINFEPVSDVEISDTLFGRSFFPPIGFVNQDGNSFGVASFSQGEETVNNGTQGALQTALTNSDDYLLSIDEGSRPVAFTGVNGKIKLQITQNQIGASINFWLASSKTHTVPWIGGSAPQNAMIYLGGHSGSGFGEIDFSGINVTFQAGETVFIYCQIRSLNNFGVGFKFFFTEGGSISFPYSNKYKPTTVRAYEPDVLLDKILERVCGKRGQSISTLLSGACKGYLLTSMDGIRGLPDATLKLSFNDFFDVYYVNTFGSMGIENDKLRFEVIDHFLNSQDTPVDLGFASNVKITVPNDLLFNTIKIGHTYKEIDGVNGKLSFNNATLFSTPSEQVKEELTLVSPAIADPYAIENVRAGFDGKTTADSGKDSDMCLLISEPSATFFSPLGVGFVAPDNYISFSQISNVSTQNRDAFVTGVRFTIGFTQLNNKTFTVKSVVDEANGDYKVYVNENVQNEVAVIATVTIPLYILKRYQFSDIQGVPTDSDIYNTDVTPKKLLMLWRRWINSGLWKMDGQKIKFESTDQNKDLKLTLNGVIVEEKADLEITSDIIWKPFNFNLDTLVPTDIFNILNQRPNAPFYFTWNNTAVKGIMWTGGVSPDNDKPQAYKLLCPADQDLTFLID